MGSEFARARHTRTAPGGPAAPDADEAEAASRDTGPGLVVERAFSGVGGDPLGGAPAPADTVRALQRRRGRGAPLPVPLADRMGEALGADVTGVRVHDDPEAHAVARSLQASAFAHGRDVYFARGAYAPASVDGQRLIAHELAHVADSEGGASAGAGPTVGRADDPAEARADRRARQVVEVLRRHHRPDAPAPAAGLGGGPASPAAIRRKFSALDGKEEGYRDEETGDVYRLRGSADWFGVTMLSLRRVEDGHTVSVRKDTMELGFETPGQRMTRLNLEPGTGGDDVEPTGQHDADAPAPTKKRKVAEDGPPQPIPVLPTVTQHLQRKAATALTVQVGLLPVEGAGERRPDGEPGYVAADLWVDDLSLGDKDRPQTQFATQRSHTVAWTLLRAELRSFQKKPLSVLLESLQARVKELEKLAEELQLPAKKTKLTGKKAAERHNLEAAQALSAKLTQAVLMASSLHTARLPLYTWQTLTADYVRVYVQAYQVSRAATFKDGVAKGHGEAAHMRMLRADEEAVASGETLDDDALDGTAYSASRMLDYKFTTAIKPQALAFAVRHWVNALVAAFPKLMAAYGQKVVAGVLGVKLKGESKALLGDGTVLDLVEKFHGKGSLFKSAPPSSDLTPPSPTALMQVESVRIPLPEGLATAFTVLADLAPDYSDVDQKPESGDPSTGMDIEDEGSTDASDDVSADDSAVDAPRYPAGQMRIRRLWVSDRDRPRTQFKSGQMSHTTPWTLMRAGLEGHRGKSAHDLILFLQSEFSRLKSQVNPNNKAALKLLNSGMAGCGVGSTAELPAALWQTAMSDLVRAYAVVYQLGSATSYVDASSLGRALGHGEARHMAALRAAEAALANGRKPTASVEAIAAAARALIDISPGDTLTAVEGKQVFDHWLRSLTAVFPNVVEEFGPDLRKAVLSSPLPGQPDQTVGQWIGVKA